MVQLGCRARGAVESVSGAGGIDVAIINLKFKNEYCIINQIRCVTFCYVFLST